MIAERVEVPRENFENIAMMNARAADPATRVVRRGTRIVNGTEMMLLEFEARQMGIPFRYIGHYYSDAAGSIQVIGFTARNLIDEYRALIDAFVAGLEVTR